MQTCAKSEFSLDRLSHRIGLAPAEFSRLFRASTGQTPLRVYNELIISQAEAELVHAQSIKEVVYKLGFQSPSHFTALYRKVKGHSPSELRLSKS
jgi:AraC-like DNA-binding protein